MQSLPHYGDRGILEVGSGTSPLRKLLPNRRIVFLDPDRVTANVDLFGAGSSLPFHNESFDITVSTDVLEHVPSVDRSRFLSELARVTSEVLILGFPNDDPLVQEADRALFEFIKGLDGSEYPFLREHMQLGLPNVKEIRIQLEAHFESVLEFQNAGLDSWLLLMMTEFVLQKNPEFIRARKQFHDFFNQYYESVSHHRPCYRTFLVAFRKSVASDLRETLQQLGEDVKPDDVATFSMNSLGLTLAFQDALKPFKQGQQEAATYQKRLEESIRALEKRLSVAESELTKHEEALRRTVSKLKDRDQRLATAEAELRHAQASAENLQAYLNLFLSHPLYRIYRFFKRAF